MAVRRWSCRSRSPGCGSSTNPGPSAVYNMAIALQLRVSLIVEALRGPVRCRGRHGACARSSLHQGNSRSRSWCRPELAEVGWEVGRHSLACRAEHIAAVARGCQAPLRSVDRDSVRATCPRRRRRPRPREWCITSPVTAVRMTPLVGISARRCRAVCRSRPRPGAVAGAVHRLHRLAARRVWGSRGPRQRDRRPVMYWEQALAGMPDRWCCPPIGPIRRWLITGAPPWWWTGRPSCSRRCGRWRSRSGATSFMVMQAALAVLRQVVARTSGCGGGLPIAGRNDPASR